MMTLIVLRKIFRTFYLKVVFVFFAFFALTGPASLAQSPSANGADVKDTSRPNSADVKDTSRPIPRSVNAYVQWSNSNWDESQQKVSGNPIVITFSGPAAPLE